MSELFQDLPVQLSPRLAWVQKNHVLTHYFEDAAPGQEWMAIAAMPEDSGLSIAECMARHCRIYDEGGLIGYGETEKEAQRDLGIKIGVPLWNEEPSTQH